MPQSFGPPPNARTLVEFISSEGYVSPDESDRIRCLAHLRNEFIHGNLDIPIDKQETAFFLEIISRLEKTIEETPASVARIE
jgi:uncharacterized protein YutE (UPF0331/DUF86 family)